MTMDANVDDDDDDVGDAGAKDVKRVCESNHMHVMFVLDHRLYMGIAMAILGPPFSRSLPNLTLLSTFTIFFLFAIAH
jgi:hypothetical protein